MQKAGVYSVYDQKAEAFISPFFLPNDQIAIRAFSDCVSDDNHQFGRHPSDYSLYKIGQFNQENGLFEDNEPKIIISGFEMKAIIRKENDRQQKMIDAMNEDQGDSPSPE
jgi:hypothetical protein